MSRSRTLSSYSGLLFALLVAASVPGRALAQSPFQTGADAFVTNLTAIATPLAVILVMALGVAALAGRLSWGWSVAALVGIAVVFGAPQIVTWVRGMFAV